MNTYNTASAPGAQGKGGITLGHVLLVATIIVAGIVIYKYVIKPANEKEKQETAQA